MVVSVMGDGLKHSGLKEITEEHPWEFCAYHFCHCSSKQNKYALLIIPHISAYSSDSQERETVCSAIMDTTLRYHFWIASSEERGFVGGVRNKQAKALKEMPWHRWDSAVRKGVTATPWKRAPCSTKMFHPWFSLLLPFSHTPKKEKKNNQLFGGLRFVDFIYLEDFYSNTRGNHCLHWALSTPAVRCPEAYSQCRFKPRQQWDNA